MRRTLHTLSFIFLLLNLIFRVSAQSPYQYKEIIDPDYLYQENPIALSDLSDYTLRLTDLRNAKSSIDVEEIPAFLLGSVFFNARDTLWVESYWDWGYDRFRSTPLNAFHSAGGSPPPSDPYLVYLHEKFKVWTEDGFRFIKHIKGQNVFVDDYFCVDLNALPRMRIAYGEDPTQKAPPELRIFIPFEKNVKSDWTILSNGAMKTIPANLQHSANIKYYRDTSTPLPDYQSPDGLGICVIFYAIDKYYPRPEYKEFNAISSMISSARNYRANRREATFPDFGYEGYYFCKESEALAGLPQRETDYGRNAGIPLQKNGDFTINYPDYDSKKINVNDVSFGYDSRFIYVLNRKGMTAEEKPTNRLVGSLKFERKDYIMILTDAVTGAERIISQDSPLPYGSNEWYTYYLLVTNRYLHLYLNNGTKVNLTNPTTGKKYFVKKK